MALFPGGSKADLDSQRTSPIMFAELKEIELCPVRAFVDWLKAREIERDGNGLRGNPTARVFPAFRKNSKLETGLFSRKVKDMERSWPQKLVEYRAHSGRFSITTLAMFSKDNNGNRLIEDTLLEHQLTWTRDSKVLANYMGHNASLVKGGFLQKMKDLRDQDNDQKIDEEAVKTFASKNLNDDFLTSLNF